MPNIVFGEGTTATGYRVNKNTTGNVTNARGQACKVLNNSTRDYFIPTKTRQEWDAFSITGRPANVTAGCCGDTICHVSLSETCSSCPGDCGVCPPVCGDGTCNGTETCSSCSSDCGACVVCGDSICSSSETSASCPADCPGCCLDLLQSQPAGCSGLICRTDIGANNYCFQVCNNASTGFVDKNYYTSEVNWTGWGTVDSGCRQQATSALCGTTAHCGWLNALPKCLIACGDGICNGTETCTTCSSDCGACPAVCGDGVCSGTETCSSCLDDCFSSCSCESITSMSICTHMAGCAWDPDSDTCYSS